MSRFLALIIIILLQGCVVAAVGGAAYVGYEVGKDERGVKTVASDANLTATVKTKLIQDKQVKARHINVDTYAGVVTLHGHVESKSLANRAVSLASSVKGVKKVNSKLVIVEQN
jgi:hyperosmotically inducible protein